MDWRWWLWWVLASTVGWAVGGFVSGITNTTAGWAVLGAVYGAITGLALVWQRHRLTRIGILCRSGLDLTPGPFPGREGERRRRRPTADAGMTEGRRQ